LAAIRREVPPNVTIVAITKGRSIDECRRALAAGLTDLGENRVQEALPKIEALPEARWHLVGHLQTNKARHAGRFAMVQSVDGARVAAAIARHAPGLPCLLEVNVSREPQKQGCSPKDAVNVAREVVSLLDLRGLMCVAAAGRDATPEFNELRDLRDACQQGIARELPILSMGMTDDWRAALAAGSSMLRLGRALFG